VGFGKRQKTVATKHHRQKLLFSTVMRWLKECDNTAQTRSYSTVVVNCTENLLGKASSER